jgi:transcriptional regulator with XRE-family HTH domain
MSEAATLLREARYAAGLTQAALAERLDVSQAAIAKLERQGANPSVNTLDTVLSATGHRLELSAAPARRPDADESPSDKLY